MALFNKATITAAVDTGPRASRTEVDKLFLSDIIDDVAKGIFSTAGNTFPELFWDTSRIAFVWGQGGINAPDIYMQRQSSAVLELIDAANTTRQGFHVGTMDLDKYQDFAEVATPANPSANHARLYSKDDGGTTKLFFRDSAGVETELGASSIPAFGDLTDVTITGIGANELIQWSGSAWINRTLAEAGVAPASHVHAAADITSGIFAVVRGGTGLATLTSGSFLKGTGAAAVTMRTPAQVLSDIGAAAASHVHSAADITSGILAVVRGGTGVAVSGSGSGYDADFLDGLHASVFLLADGTAPLTAPWDAGSFEIRAKTFEVDDVAPTTPAINNIYSDSIIKAWLHIDSDYVIDDDYNVASVTDNGAGDLTVTWATAMPSANYAPTFSVLAGTGIKDIKTWVMTIATGSVRLGTSLSNVIADKDIFLVVTGS